MATASRVKIIRGFGLLFPLISAISYLLRVSRASIAAFNIGVASFNCFSASSL